MSPSTTWTNSVDSGSSAIAVSNTPMEVVELQLLLPRAQVAALESAARRRGMTTGQILRRIIADLFPVDDEANSLS